MSTTLTGQKTGAEGQGGDASGGTGGTGSQITDWRSSLPENLRGEKVFESIKGKDLAEALPNLAQQFVHAQKMVGADKIVIPGKDATPEQVAEYRKKLGVPEKPEDYALALPEGLTEDKVDKQFVDTWRKRLHAQGVPKAAAEAIIKDYLADNVAKNAADTKAAEDQAKAWQLEMKTKFGSKYDETVNMAQHALEHFKDEKLIEWLESTGAGNHPAVVEFFSKVGKLVSDDRVARGGSGSSTGAPRTPAAAQAALNEFHQNSDKMKALFEKDHPNHEAVVKERADLFRAAYPSEKQE